VLIGGLFGCRDRRRDPTPTQTSDPRVETVAAAEDLPPGAVLGISSIGKITVPGTLGQRIPLADARQLFGRKLVRAVKARQPLTWADIEPAGSGEMPSTGGSDPTNRAAVVGGAL
jgi:hypothetical protein